MKLLVRLLVVSVLVALAAIPAATAADRMWMGFHDDPVFRWNDGRMDELDKAVLEHATIIRTLVTWANVAPTKPANASDPFDPAYKLDDVDELVRNAQQRGHRGADHDLGHAEVGERRQDAEQPADERERLPAVRAGDRRALLGPVRRLPVRALLRGLERVEPRTVPVAPVRRERRDRRAGASTRSSRRPRTRASRPATRRRSSRSARPRLTGATSRCAGNSDTISPGMFAQLVAKANPRLKFDAWAHHPYPYPVFQKPAQKVKWPNVSLSLAAAVRDVDRLLVPPHEHPGLDHGVRPRDEARRAARVTEAQQAAYIPQAIALAQKDPHVQMFIWFVFRDSQGSTWQSGLYRQNGAPKPGLAKWRSATPTLTRGTRASRSRAERRIPR